MTIEKNASLRGDGSSVANDRSVGWPVVTAFDLLQQEAIGILLSRQSPAYGLPGNVAGRFVREDVAELSQAEDQRILPLVLNDGGSGSCVVGNAIRDCSPPTDALQARHPGVDSLFVDNEMPPAALARAGIFIDRSMNNRERVGERELLLAGDYPQFRVRFENRSCKDRLEPNFVVHADGTIEMNHNPEALPLRAVITVELSRHDGQLSPTRQQQTALDELMGYLIHRMCVNANESLPHLEDFQGLVSQKALPRAFDNSVSGELAPETKKQIQNMNRFRGGGHGTISGADISRYFPEGDHHAKHREAIPLHALKDTVAAMFNPSHRHPYDTIRQRAGGCLAVGRYGITADLLEDWLGDDADVSQSLFSRNHVSLAKAIRNLAAHNKLPKEFARKFQNEQFAKGFLQFLQKLHGEGHLTKHDIHKFLPGSLQEEIANSLVEKNMKNYPGHPEQTVLAMNLGKRSRLTAEEMDDSRNQQIMEASTKMFALAIAKEQVKHGQPIEWQDSGDGSVLALRIAEAAERNAQRTNTVGWCYRGVANTLQRFGISLEGRSAYMAADQLASSRRFEEVTGDKLKPGDILVHGRSQAHKHGHIAVYLGRGREASDHVQQLISGRGYGGTRIFRAAT